MRTRLRRFALLCFTLSLVVVTAGQSLAVDELEETRSLLQQGLTIHELNREVAGLSVKEVHITMQILENQERLKEKTEQVRQTRERAKHVLDFVYLLLQTS